MIRAGKNLSLSQSVQSSSQCAVMVSCRRRSRRFFPIFFLILLITSPFLSERLKTAHPSQQLRSPPSEQQSGSRQRFDCKWSLRLLTPTFLLHLFWMSILFLVSVVTAIDVLLQLVFISCSLAIGYATVTTLPEVKADGGEASSVNVMQLVYWSESCVI